MLAKLLILSAALLHAADVDWPVNGGPYNIRYTTLSQITPANVGQLRVAWSYDSHDSFKDSEMQSNPIVVDGMLFATTPTLHVVALDAVTGRELWKFDPSGGDARQRRYRHRGVTVYQDRVFVSWRNFLFALDKRTGVPLASFGKDGRIDLRENLGRPVESASISASSPGVIFEDMIIMGSTVPETLPGTPGHIRAFDVHTGKMRWIFHTIPQPGEFGYETWPKNAYEISGGANAWAGLSIDPKLGMVFAATGSASFDFYGSNRIGDNLFADCVLALDARTGRRVWHFQGVRHDVWDLDFPAAPSLVTVTRNGRPVEAVAQITKSGYVYVLDRRTGKPLFPIGYRKAPASPLDGEKLSTEQPYPLKPPPFTRQTFDESIITNRTPEAHAAVLETFRKLDSKGIYTPPSGRGTILFPGTDGGGEWGGAAFDPATGLLYVNSNEQPWIIRMVTHDTRSLYKNNCANCHGDDRKGSPQFPSLIDIGQRRTRAELSALIREGTGRMPGFSHLGRGIDDIVEYLTTGRDTGTVDPAQAAKDPNWQKYRNEGYILFRDPEGYPPLTPPWGTLNAIDLNKGEIRWQIPFGEYPELAAKGLKDTGSDNYGGPVVTASGLLFIGATNFDKKFRAFDKLTGKLLWETVLPAAGNATPSVYQIGGREYVVIVCGGGKNDAPSGSSIVAFALPEAAPAADDRIQVDNESVRAIKAEVQPHVRGALHRHEFNRVIIALDAGELTVVNQDGSKEVQPWKAGQVVWSPVTGMHTSENTGTRPFRLVEVEIKKPPPAAPPARNAALDPVALDPRHNVLLFENPQVRVFRSWREPGGTEKMHEHAGAGRLTVLLTDLNAELKTPGGPAVEQHGAAGDILWSGPVTHAATNTGAKRFEMVVVEVK